MSDRASERKSEAARLCGELGHWMQHRDRQDECPLIERALIEAEDAAVSRERENTRKLRALAQRIDAFECECEEIEGCAPCIAREAAEALR